MILLPMISFLRFLVTFTRPLCYKLFDVLWRIIFGRQKMLPPVDNKILLMSATQLANYIRKRKVTAEEVMKVYIKRVKEVNPVLNACVDERFEEALADARAVDMMLKAGTMSEQQLASDMPLLGVPFTCKEHVGVKGLYQTSGLLSLKDRKAPSDADAVMEYRKAGAIPFVVTNVPTICLWWETSNLAFGRTLNPYDNRRTAGGSSGGEASLLASAGAAIGIGSDIGGSIRMPSAFCGIYGHKPTRGIISLTMHFPDVNEKYNPFRTVGPMCRYVQDLRTLVHILSGEDSSKLQLDEKVDFSKVKIYYMEEMPGFLLSATSDVKSAVRKAVTHFEEKYKVTPVRVDLEELRYGFELWQCKLIEAAGPAIKTALERNGKINWYQELLKCLFRRAQFDLPVIFSAIGEKGDKDKRYYECLELFDSLKRKMEDILSEDSILLLPTHPEPSPHIWTTYVKLENIGYTCIFNALGYPATNIPAGFSYGVPIGLQAVAAECKDHLTIAAAEELDKIFGGWRCPCEIQI